MKTHNSLTAEAEVPPQSQPEVDQKTAMEVHSKYIILGELVLCVHLCLNTRRSGRGARGGGECFWDFFDN